MPVGRLALPSLLVGLKEVRVVAHEDAEESIVRDGFELGRKLHSVALHLCAKVVAFAACGVRLAVVACLLKFADLLARQADVAGVAQFNGGWRGHGVLAFGVALPWQRRVVVGSQVPAGSCWFRSGPVGSYITLGNTLTQHYRQITCLRRALAMLPQVASDPWKPAPVSRT